MGQQRKPRAVFAAYLLYCLSGIAVLLSIVYPPLYNETTSPKTAIIASYTQYDSYGDVPSPQPGISTTLRVIPPGVVELPNSVTVTVEASQWKTIRNTRNPPIALDRVVKPIHMSLESSDFDFASGSNERSYFPGAIIPFTATWTPSPRKAGKLLLLLRLKNIDHLKLIVGGVAQEETGNNDVPIPVTVRETSGLTPWQQRWLLWVVAALGAISGLIVQWLCSRPKRQVHSS